MKKSFSFSVFIHDVTLRSITLILLTMELLRPLAVQATDSDANEATGKTSAQGVSSDATGSAESADKILFHSRIYQLPQGPRSLDALNNVFEELRPEALKLERDRDPARVRPAFIHDVGGEQKIDQTFSAFAARTRAQVTAYLKDRMDTHNVILTLTRGTLNGVLSFYTLGFAASLFEGIFSASAMVANKDLGNAVNRAERSFPGGGIAAITVLDVGFLIGLASFAALGPNPLNWTLLQFLKTVGFGLASRGMAEWATQRHREIHDLAIDPKDPRMAEKRKYNQRRANNRGFFLSLLTSAAVTIDLPANAITMADFFEFFSKVEFTTLSFGVMALGATTIIAKLIKHKGKWSLAVNETFRSLNLNRILRSVYKDAPNWLPNKVGGRARWYTTFFAAAGGVAAYQNASNIELSTVTFSLLTAAGALYALWTMKEHSGSWKLAWFEAIEKTKALKKIPGRVLKATMGKCQGLFNS